MTTTKIFWSGRSQAVRIPKEFRLDGTEATISRVGSSLVIEPIEGDWSWVDRAHSQGGLDVEAADEALRHEPAPDDTEATDLFA